MSDGARLEDLRRRIEKDPASIAFAQLAEECRRVGRNEEAIEICRRGLERHPGYVSARVTLGRALLQVGELDEAEHELTSVLQGAPQNLAALRALGDIQRRRGDLPEALEQYRAALRQAPNDPELERATTELSDSLNQAATERENARIQSIVATLDAWLTAVDVTRSQRSA